MALQAVHCENGVVLYFDPSIQVGALITAYHSGFHVLTRIEFRGDNQTPVFHYMRVIKEDGTRVKSSKTVMSCDASYCRHVTRQFVEEQYAAAMTAATTMRANLLDFVPAEG